MCDSVRLLYLLYLLTLSQAYTEQCTDILLAVVALERGRRAVRSAQFDQPAGDRGGEQHANGRSVAPRTLGRTGGKRGSTQRTDQPEM